MAADDSGHGKTSQKALVPAPQGPHVQRRWERLPIAIPVFVRGADDRGKEFVEFSTAININAGGMLLVSRRPLPPGSLLSLEIPTPTPFYHPPGILGHGAMAAKVLYMNYADGYNLCGAEFETPLIDGWMG